MANRGDSHIISPDEKSSEFDDSSAKESSLVHHYTELSYSGPLPPPNVLEGYEKILPGLADRIVTMAEKQQEHRIALEKIVVEGGSKRADQGIYAAVIIEGMFLATSCYLAHLGLSGEALQVVGGSAVGLITTFGFGTVSRRSERIRKKQIQTSDEKSESQPYSANLRLLPTPTKIIFPGGMCYNICTVHP